jgi:hypothetical protein
MPWFPVLNQKSAAHTPNLLYMPSPFHCPSSDHSHNMVKTTDPEASHCPTFSISFISYFLGQNILLSTLISNTLNLCPTLNVKDKFHITHNR